ncbi:16S rRNA (uracil(1498)-N(3))-methyltransferase [Vagococcus salmoninarum]|uniref:16S rRNA (uracil(1498)-N(3))-methyltransferase n=1 Tax=Vagococcus salmoninarum TaxID=2739 RepID=UPI003F9B88C6
MQRYFSSQTYEESQQSALVLSGDDFHHSIHVMRMKAGDQCYLVFADQVAIIAELTEVLAETVSLREVSRETQEKELPVAITIASGYPKGDKLDLIVQKGTELGAYQFVGFPGQTSVVKWDAKKLNKRQERLTKIAKEAAEQSHRLVQPEVTLYSQMSEFMATLANYDHVLVAYEESAKAGEHGQLVKTLSQIKPGESLLAVFGPEGGLSPQEIQTFLGAGGSLCALGPRILRTETAPFYLLSAASYQLELLKDF